MFLLFLLVHQPAAFSVEPKPLEIRNGTIIPKLLWKDNTFKDNLLVIQITDSHVFLRDDAQVLAIRHEHLISLHETTHQNLVSAKINQTANKIGGSKPGTIRKQHISPGHIFPRLVWTDGEEKRLVEVLNIKSGYYVLRVDGKTAAISQEEFLSVLENTENFLSGGGLPKPQSPPKAKPELGENPFLVTNLPPPNFPKALPTDQDLPKINPPENHQDSSSALTKKNNKSAATFSGEKTKKTGKTIGPPPPPPSTAPTSTRPIQFDFKFSGDASPPTIEK